MFPHTWFQSKWQSLYQGSVLQNYLAFKETLQKISQTLWDHFLAWYTIIYPPPSRVYMLYPSSFPCVYTGTCYVQFFSWVNTTSPYTGYNQQRTWVWNLLDSGLQIWLLTDMQASIQDNLAKIWRYQRQIWVDLHIWAHSCCWLSIQFLYHIFHQVQSTSVVLVILYTLSVFT